MAYFVNGLNIDPLNWNVLILQFVEGKYVLKCMLVLRFPSYGGVEVACPGCTSDGAQLTPTSRIPPR